MTTDEVLSILETDVEDPGSEKSGEHLEAHVLAHARAIARHSPESLEEALRRWLAMRSLPRTLVAIRIAGILKLTALEPDLESLLVAVKSGDVPRWYGRHLEVALSRIDEARRSSP